METNNSSLDLELQCWIIQISTLPPPSIKIATVCGNSNPTNTTTASAGQRQEAHTSGRKARPRGARIRSYGSSSRPVNLRQRNGDGRPDSHSQQAPGRLQCDRTDPHRPSANRCHRFSERGEEQRPRERCRTRLSTPRHGYRHPPPVGPPALQHRRRGGQQARELCQCCYQ